MRFQFLFLLIFLPALLQASFSKLGKEFLGNNLTLKSESLSKQSSDYDLQMLHAQKSFRTSLSTFYNDNSLDTSSSFNMNLTTTKTYSLDFATSNFWGTSFALKNSLTQIDLSRINPAFLGASPTNVTEFSQTLSLTQSLGRNFFGRQERLALDVQSLLTKTTSKSTEMSRDIQLETFYQIYLTYCLQLKMKDFHLEALKRAKSRTQLIEQKYKDGLREKADTFQAKNSELEIQESVLSLESNITQTQEKLSSLLGRSITPEDAQFEDLFKETPSIKSKIVNETNKELLILKDQLEAAKMKEQIQSWAVNPNVDLQLNYKTNDYDPASGEAVSNGNLTGEASDLSLGLLVTLPIGLLAEKIEREKAGLERLKREYQYRQKLNDLPFEEESLRGQINHLSQNLDSSKTRVQLSENALKEYTKLYNLGRTDLDQLIRAEESLIQTQQGLVSNSYNKKILEAKLANLYGELQGFLFSSESP